MKPQRYKSVSLTVATFYSLVFHAVVLGSVLTMPIYGGEGYIESYLVYLPESESEASKEKVKSPETEVQKGVALSPEKKPPAKALRAAAKAPESEKVSRAPKTPEKKTPVKPERQRKTKMVAPKKSPIMKTDARETASKKVFKTEEKKPLENRAEDKSVAEEKPERRVEPLLEAVEETPVRMARRIEKPVVKKEPPPQAKEKPVGDGGYEKVSAVPADRKPEEGSKEVFDRPGWQEPVKQIEPAEEKLIRDTEDTEPVLLEPQGGLLSRLYENPAEEIIQQQQEPAVTVVPADTETQDSFTPEVEICEDCTLVSKLYKNTAFDIMEDFEVSIGVPEQREPQDGFLPQEHLCEDCDIVSSEYENPAKDIMDYRAELETSFGLMPGEVGGSGPDSKLDLLCMGCFMVAMLDENPAEGIIYDYGPGRQVSAGGDVLSALEEFCSGCAKPFESTGDVKYGLWDSSGTETSGSAEVVATAPEETTVKSVVIEVSDAELSLSKPEASVVEEDNKVNMLADIDMEDPVAAILTPAENRTPSVEDYLIAMDEDLKRLEKLESSKEKSGGEGPGLPLYSPRDMEIRVFFDGSGEGVSFRLMKRPHPMTDASGKATEVTEEFEEMIISEGSGLRRMFLLARAEKGVYIFIIEHDGLEALDLGVSFLLYGGLGQERAREYEGISLVRGGSIEIKVLMPEAIFWDDEDYFTGEIEGPNSITKFNDETGLVWKEKNRGY